MATGATLLGAVKDELGTFFDTNTFPDARITDYLNEGQAVMAPDIGRTTSALMTVGENDLELQLPANFIRIVQLLPDPNFTGTGRIPPYELTDDAFVWLDKQGRTASSFLMIYEARHAPFGNDGTVLTLPDPGPEGLVAFACMRCMQRLIGDRAAYKRYATQTGTNVIQAEDMERLAEVWHQRYLQSRELLALRTRVAQMEQVAQY